MQQELLTQLRVLFNDPTEVLAVLLGMVSVWLVTRRSIWAFPIGIVMVLLYVGIFYDAKLYSDMLLQVFFAVMQMIGWWQWAHGQKDAHQKIEVRSLSLRQILLTVMLIGIGTLALGRMMQRYTDADVPYPDALTTSISVLAQWWLNQRYLQNWILWIVADVLYLGLYWYKGLFLTALLYLIFLALAIQGYRAWKRALPKPTEE